MWTVVKLTPSVTNSLDTTRLNASSAALDATYAEKRGGPVCTPIEEMFTTWPNRRSVMWGSSASNRRTGP